MIDFDELVGYVAGGDEAGALALTRRALEAGVPTREILEKGLVRALDIVGGQFARGEIYFPELLLAGDAMKEALELLKPELSRGGGGILVGKYIIGTVRGDLHDIGKNMDNPLATILSGALMLRYSCELPAEAAAIEDAAHRVLEQGYRTWDIMEHGKKLVGTCEMGDLVAQEVKKAAS